MHVGGWKLIDYEMSMTGSKCFSGHYADMGSVATIYSRGSIPFVLQWLAGHQRPYDHVFSYLAHLGIPIRITQPNLAIAELDKASSVDPHRKGGEDHTREVNKKHRWQPLDYFPVSALAA